MRSPVLPVLRDTATDAMRALTPRPVEVRYSELVALRFAVATCRDREHAATLAGLAAKCEEAWS